LKIFRKGAHSHKVVYINHNYYNELKPRSTIIIDVSKVIQACTIVSMSDIQNILTSRI
jgi:hypothetical protein